MNESKIREQIKAPMGLVNPQSLTSQEEYGHVLQGATGIIVLLYGRGSVQLSSFQAGVVAEEKRVAKEWHESQRGSMAQFFSGVLSNVLAELDAGLIGSIRQQAEGEVLADFVALSRAALDEKGDQAKNVAAVLAAAAFEDTIRRLGAIHAGTAGGEKLADVVTALKTSGFLQGSQVGIAQSYLNFRNRAMHAEWDKIESEAVSSALGFVEQLVLKYF